MLLGCRRRTPLRPRRRTAAHSQSPLSRSIKEPEEELGTRFFVRIARRTQLTRMGRLFLEHVRRVFATLDQVRDSVKFAPTVPAEVLPAGGAMQ